jgi:putative ABC transport system permease protein
MLLAGNFFGVEEGFGILSCQGARRSGDSFFNEKHGPSAARQRVTGSGAAHPGPDHYYVPVLIRELLLTARQALEPPLGAAARECRYHSAMPFSQATLAVRNLTRHRTRTLISLSAIAFGVIALLLAGGFVEWMFWAMRAATIQTGLGHVQISRPGFRDAGFANPSAYLLPADAAELKLVRSAPGAKAVDQRLAFSGLASKGSITVAYSGLAVDPDAEKLISDILPVAGEHLDASDPSGVLLGRGLAAALLASRGDRVTLVVNLPGGGINAVEARVRGTFATHVKAHDDSAVRMPIALGRELLRVDGSHLWVVALEGKDDDTEDVMAYLKPRLSDQRFELATWFELSDFYRKAVSLMSRQVDVVALLIGVIIVLGISNTLTMNVLERTGEIGTMMALGTPRRSILQLFLLEGVLLGIVGGVTGLVIGFLLAQGISYVGIPMPPPPGRDAEYSAEIMLTVPVAVAAFGMAVISTALASLYPARKAARLPIVDALRHNV